MSPCHFQLCCLDWQAGLEDRARVGVTCGQLPQCDYTTVLLPAQAFQVSEPQTHVLKNGENHGYTCLRLVVLTTVTPVHHHHCSLSAP